MKSAVAALTLTSLLCGCAVGPNYHVQPLPGITPATWKADPGWRPATPADAGPKDRWWQAFNDPELDRLEARVPAANQTVAAALAALDQARGLVRETRAGLFPTVSLNGGVSYSHGGGGNTILTSTGGTTTGTGTGTTTGGGTTTGTGTGGTGTGTGTGTGIGTGTGVGGTTTGTTIATSGNSTRITLGASASWEPDLFGRIRRGLESARASEAASAGDLANALLTAQGTLATDYVQLRSLDEQAQLYRDTVQAYARALQITTNRYKAGVAAKSDVLQAQVQLQVADANLTDIGRQRAPFENAIATLTGENAASFRIPVRRWAPVVPAVPAVIPSALAERRPDVAAAERRVAAANAQIGVQLAAYFPTFDLTANGSTAAASIGSLFAASTNLWSVGASVVQTLLDFGARRGRVEQARGAWRQAVANYRQTALTAFEDVENQLAAATVLVPEEAERRAASQAADQEEAIALNQYKAGQIAYTDVILQQTAALSARLNLVVATQNRQLAAVGLAQALGGSGVVGEPAGLRQAQAAAGNLPAR